MVKKKTLYLINKNAWLPVVLQLLRVHIVETKK